MIEIKEVTQAYQDKEVLHSVNLTVNQNEVCALVGHNGAGKSTLIHSMLDLIPVKKGQIMLAGIPHTKEEWKKHVAYLPEKFMLYPQLTGEENMRFFASLADKQVNEKKIEEKLSLVRLWDSRSQKVKGYSKGMLQRLGLAIMFYFEPEILILDEPTSGLDPMGRVDILSILKSLDNMTILLSSHHIDEIRQVCTHVAYLHDGTIDKYTVNEFCEKYSTGGY
ncbi:ABC transporter ATP-binding protein [Brevibacillus ginsengisoli]|uniref:ABC transporter ATP-binding protein n=1 Tax=Brevibacillus ginsengisoli TaxID=363854 RepID=UPI003CECE578